MVRGLLDVWELNVGTGLPLELVVSLEEVVSICLVFDIPGLWVAAVTTSVRLSSTCCLCLIAAAALAMSF